MGFWDGMRNAITSPDDSGTEVCPECGASLVSDGPPDDRGTERFECSKNCNEPVHFRENSGPLMTPTQRNHGGVKPCTACGQSMAGAELTDAWENGNNSNAFVTCPHCGSENPQFGFGGDD